MASYTIYHPKSVWNTIPPQHLHNNLYCTQVLIHYLKEKLIEHNHEIDVTYFDVERTDVDSFIINFKISELNLDLQRCPDSLWFILANNDTGKFLLFDMQDFPVMAYILNNNDNLITSFVGQCSYERLRLQINNITKIVPFIYPAYYPILTKSLREEMQDLRRSVDKLDDRIFFYGNNRDTYIHNDGHGESQKIREVISLLEQKYPDESCVGSWESKLPLQDFFKKAATHTINLALPGHQWCSREHELWTLGLPVMMYEHTHRMLVEPIPNHHYIAVAAGPRLSIGMAKDPELAADRIIETHREWIKPENRWRLDMIAKNGQDRIDNFAGPDVIWNTIFPSLAIGHW